MQIVRFKSSDIDPYPLDVVGEQSYREEIEEVAGFVDEDEGINDDSFWAHLVLDDNNSYDPGNAVAVEINGKTVGYLSKPNAKKYRKRLKELSLGDVVGECHASIKGGFAKRDGTIADFGVRLDIVLDELKIYTPPSPKPMQPAAPIAPVIKPMKPTIPAAGSQPKKKPRFTPRDILVAFLGILLLITSIINWLRTP